MARTDLQNLEVGTLLYNGHTEGKIVMDGGIKVIEVYIPIYGMSNDAIDFNERPEHWTVL